MKYFLKRLCVILKCVYFPTDLHCEFQRSSLKKDWPYEIHPVFFQMTAIHGRHYSRDPFPALIMGVKLDFFLQFN